MPTSWRTISRMGQGMLVASDPDSEISSTVSPRRLKFPVTHHRWYNFGFFDSPACGVTCVQTMHGGTHKPVFCSVPSVSGNVYET